MTNDGSCKECECDYTKHKHIYYTTKFIEGKKLENQQNGEDIHEASKRVIEIIKELEDELEEEQNIIQKSMAKFAQFVKSHAIAPYNDIYEDYVQLLIDQ